MRNLANTDTMGLGLAALLVAATDLQIIHPALTKTLGSSGQLENVDTAVERKG